MIGWPPRTEPHRDDDGAPPAPPDVIDGDVVTLSAPAAAAASGGAELPAVKKPVEFPLVTADGQLEPGESQTVLSNNMYLAPLFRHSARRCDFLLQVFKEKVKLVAGGGGGGGDAKLSGPVAPPLATRFAGIVREITSLYVAGQLEPKQKGVVRRARARARALL